MTVAAAQAATLPSTTIVTTSADIGCCAVILCAAGVMEGKYTVFLA